MIGQALNTYATIGPGNAAHGGLKRILTSTGGIHDRNSANQQKLAPSTSSPSLDKIVGGGGGSNSFTLGGSNRSSSSLLSLSSFNINSVYSKVWTVLVLLTRDPDPDTKSLAKALISHLRAKAEEKDRNARIPSILEGSSPGKASFLIGTSPPPSSTSSRQGAASEPPGSPVLQDRLSERRAASRKATPGAAAAAAAAPHPAPGEAMDPAGLFRMPPEVTSPARAPFPELSTQFLQWSSKYFTKQLMTNETKPGEDDHESPANWSKEWLYERNLVVRAQSEEQRHLIKTRPSKLDELQTSFKTAFMPQMMAFHPYNPQVAVAGQSMIDVRATESNATLCRINLRDWTGAGGSGSRGKAEPSFTAIQYVNAHQQALLLTGADDGCIRVFVDNEDDLLRESDVTCTTKMVTAWQAMRESAARRKMCLAWEQRQMLVAVGGSGGLVLDPSNVAAGGRTLAGAIDIWDCCQERRRASFGIGSDGGSGSRSSMAAAGEDSGSFVSCLSFSPTNPSLLGAGFTDGSTRLYDTRAPTRTSPVHTFWEHKRGEKVLRVQLQDSGGYVGHMVSGSSDGHVSIVDLRKATTARAPLDLRTQVSGVAIHRRAFIAAAWAATSQHVVVHAMLGEGPQLNVIKHQEGLLGGYKMGATGCLEFHPHLLKLATGTADGTVSIYNLKKCAP